MNDKIADAETALSGEVICTDVSLDLETFGAQPGASIATIGVVIATRVLGDNDLLYWINERELYLVVDDPEGEWSPATIRWHTRQKNPPGNVGADPDGVVMPLNVALRRLIMFLMDEAQAHKEGEAAVWTHATFDAPIVDAARLRAGLDKPVWHYRNSRDLRTLYDLAGGRPKIPNVEGHNALADARQQLEEVKACLRKLQ